MKRKVESKLISAAVRAALHWKDCREQIGKLCSPDWEKRGLKDHMWNNYIMVDIPLTTQIWKMDPENKATLFRALMEWDDSPNETDIY